ncbi:MAG: hypothetical protein ABL997_06410 [Planctomycetota bacterium]
MTEDHATATPPGPPPLPVTPKPPPRNYVRAAPALFAVFVSLLAVMIATRDDDKKAVPTAAQPDPGSTDATLNPDDVLLVVDDVTITYGDVKDQVEWLDQIAPEYSLRKKIQKVLPEYTLPVMFARREFGPSREKLFELAKTVRAASGNVEELEKNGSDRTFRRATITRGDVEVPVAAFLFEPTNIGAVSQPIEVPGGWMLVSAVDLKQARVPMEDLCEAVQVGFFTHDAKFWREWKQDLKARLQKRVSYVHPDYRLAMPPWLELP